MKTPMIAEEILSVLEQLQKLTGFGGKDAAAALAAADAVVGHLIQGVKGNVDSAAVLAQSLLISSGLQVDDNNADAALDAKP